MPCFYFLFGLEEKKGYSGGRRGGFEILSKSTTPRNYLIFRGAFNIGAIFLNAQLPRRLIIQGISAFKSSLFN